MKYKTVRNCRTTNIDKYIDCDVLFPDLSGEPSPFTATPNDSTEHGREIYEKARAGQFGKVIISKAESGYVWDGNQYIESKVDVEAIQAAEKKKYLLNEASEKISILSDAVDIGLATDIEKSNLIEWRKYRVLLNRIDNNHRDNWPEKPAN
ncbi:tail fiber assembly protein [Serratia marcescens]|nr:tail fiber assembly protein [Serratia marcescens]QFH62736.1 tail fiber assembly protein [Serratia marcescens]QFH62740.1 tail fiber assembly protein [Serratia marcescens]